MPIAQHHPEVQPCSALLRPEYPRPQYRRARWLNLNGPWAFAEDNKDVGLTERWMETTQPFAERIQVPFCRESALSGLGRESLMRCVWYAREVDIPPDWAGHRILLHAGAADYATRVWVDGRPVGVEHRGGHSSFTLDLTEALSPCATHRLMLRCEDDSARSKPHGKQRRYEPSSHVVYVQTTGIWQTVWLEPVPQAYLLRPRITPSVDQGGFWLEQRVRHLTGPARIRARLLADGREICRVEAPLKNDALATLWLAIPEAERRLWAPAHPFLYDLNISLLDEEGAQRDVVNSYAGLRSVAIRGNQVHLNGRSVFQRLVLDLMEDGTHYQGKVFIDATSGRFSPSGRMQGPKPRQRF